MKKAVAKNFLIYSLPSVLSRFIPIITLPITTKYLNLKDFGYIAIFELCIIPFQIIMSIGPGYVINSNWFKLKNQEKGELLFSIFIITATLCLIAVVIVSIASSFIFPWIAGDEWNEIKNLLPFLCVLAVSQIPVTIFNSWVIIEQKAKLSTIIKSIHIVAGASTVTLLAIYTRDYQYIIIGNVVVGFILAIIQFITLLNAFEFCLKWHWFKLICTICTPIYFRSLFNFIRTQIDKIIVSNLFGPNQFALYNFSSKVNNLMTESAGYYQNAYDPFLYKGLTNNNLNGKDVGFILFSWAYITMLFCCIFILTGDYIINKFTNGVFIDAYPLIILYTCVYVIELPFMGNGQVIIFYKHTKYLLYITIIQAFIITTLAIVLIPKYGISAGIFSLWIGTLVYMLLYYYKKRQLIKLPFLEKSITAHVVCYHIIVLTTYYEYKNVANILIIWLIISLSVHYYWVNKTMMKKILYSIKSKVNHAVYGK